MATTDQKVIAGLGVMGTAAAAHTAYRHHKDFTNILNSDIRDYIQKPSDKKLTNGELQKKLLDRHKELNKGLTGLQKLDLHENLNKRAIAEALTLTDKTAVRHSLFDNASNIAGGIQHNRNRWLGIAAGTGVAAAALYHIHRKKSNK